MTAGVDVDELIRCARRLEQLLGVGPSLDSALRCKIEEVLFERDYLESFRRGLITRAECRGVLLAHLQTLICANARIDEPSELGEDAALLAAVEDALSGPAR